VAKTTRNVTKRRRRGAPIARVQSASSSTRKSVDERGSAAPPDLKYFEDVEGLASQIKKEISVGTFGFNRKDGKNLLDLGKALVKKLQQLHEDIRLKDLIDQSTEYRLKYLKALTWCAECFYYFGWSGQVSSEAPTTLVEQESFHIRQRLSQGKPTSDLERKIAREEMWVFLHRARGFYRKHSFKEALENLEYAESFVAQHLKTKEFPCLLTQATLWCTHAHVLRQQADLVGAISFYEGAIICIQEITARGNDHRRTRVLVETGRALGLGLGWILYTRGRLNDAQTLLSAGLICLYQTDDRVHHAYAELLLGCIERARAGFDSQGLIKAISVLDGAYEGLRALSHKPYLARANYELALAYLYRAVSYLEVHVGTGQSHPPLPGNSRPQDGHPMSDQDKRDQAKKDFHDAERHLRLLEDYAGHVNAPKDPRWLANALIVKSRLERYRQRLDPRSGLIGSQAGLSRKYAEDALRLSRLYDQKFCAIDALIAVAEAKLNAGEKSGVEADLNEAIKLANKNPKTIGVCNVHLTRLYLRDRDLQKANSSFMEWERYRYRIEHSLIHDLAKDVKTDLDKLSAECLVIDGSKVLDLSTHAKELFNFLKAKALAKSSDSGMHPADVLGVPHATYHDQIQKLSDPAAKVILQVKRPARRRSKSARPPA
jgi:tetratricopeptide (TPR) repeat protein